MALNRIWRPLSVFSHQFTRPISSSTCRSAPGPSKPSTNATQDILQTLYDSGRKSAARPPDQSPTQLRGEEAVLRALRANTLSPEAQAASTAKLISQTEENTLRTALERQMVRRWAPGDVYSPHDLSSQEAKKWKQLRRNPRVDVFDQLGTDPMKHYKNPALLASFVNETGRIKHNKETGLRGVNQRRMARAVRRAVGQGILPSVYMHPELVITRQRVARERANGGWR